MTETLRTVALTKAYSSDGADFQALNGVDFSVAAGEFVAIMGPSGCGKSTLLHMLGGLDRPTSGEIYLAGKRVDALSERGWALLRRRQIGYMFQSFNLITNMSAADNIELPALMGQLGIVAQSGMAPGRMSGGQQQRVALARAMINEPEVLLADEPTGNLDSQATREVLAILKECHERGQTLVLVTHDANVASAADRVVRMRDGGIVGENRLEGHQPSRDILRSVVGLEV